MKIIIINGPNLNLLGKRETSIYGNESFEEYLKKIKKEFNSHEIDYFQSNIEGELINTIHNTGFIYDGIILNAGAYSHTSIAIADAIRAIHCPVIEVHLSNIFAREDFRHKSTISPVVKGIISGFGMKSYSLAINALEEIKKL
ncbi:MAG: type II 3-dehydroquinate dehydratase [Bacteroidales bacterium]